VVVIYGRGLIEGKLADGTDAALGRQQRLVLLACNPVLRLQLIEADPVRIAVLPSELLGRQSLAIGEAVAPVGLTDALGETTAVFTLVLAVVSDLLRSVHL